MRSLKIGIAAAVLATAMTGCSGGDTAACEAITNELKTISSKGMSQISDPTGLAKTYTDGAAKVRDEGKKAGGDVETAANELAASMDDFGRILSSGAGEIPDAGAFSKASVKVAEACK